MKQCGVDGWDESLLSYHSHKPQIMSILIENSMFPLVCEPPRGAACLHCRFTSILIKSLKTETE